MKSPLDLVRHYLDQLWVHLSVVRMQNTNQQTSSSTFNRTYLATFIVFSIAVVYGIFGLHRESGHPLTIDSLRASPYIFWRQITLKQIWPQMDITLAVLLLGDCVVLLDFTFKEVNWWHQFRIIFDQNRVDLDGKAAVLSKDESTQLLVVFHRARLTYKIFAFAYYLPSLFYSYAMVFCFSKVFTVSFCSLVYWFIIWPYTLLLIVLFLFVSLLHIIVGGSAIQIRQQYHYQKFTQILAKLTRKRKPKESQLKQVWPHYLHFNQAILSIGLQLVSFNTFYTNYQTVIFLQYTIIQVLFTYVVFFGPSNSIAMLAIKCIFTVGILEMTVLLFGLIQYCSRVVKRNGQIGKVNRHFAVHCLQHQGRYQLRVGQLLKLELLQWPHLLHFYAFKLFGNSRITSKTFYAMAINISGFFLFVTKRM